MNTIVLWHTASQSRAQFYQLQNKVNFFFLSLLLLPLLACHINVVFRQGPHTRTSGCCCFPFAFHLCFLPCHLFLCRDIDWNRAHTVDAISCAAPSMVRTRGSCPCPARLLWNAGAFVLPGVIAAWVIGDIGFSVVRSRSPLLALDERRIPVLPDHWRAKRSSPSKAFQLLTSKRGDHLIGLDLTR